VNYSLSVDRNLRNLSRKLSVIVFTVTDSAELPPTHDPYSPDLQHALLTFETMEWGDPPKLVSTKKRETEERISGSTQMTLSIVVRTPLRIGTVTKHLGITQSKTELILISNGEPCWWIFSGFTASYGTNTWLCHIDHEMQIPPKLDTWAVYVSRTHIREKKIASLMMNTQKPWKSLTFDQVTKMDDQEPQDPLADSGPPWTDVPLSKRQQRKNLKNRTEGLDHTTGVSTKTIQPQMPMIHRCLITQNSDNRQFLPYPGQSPP
jgi:hypothetical protein